MGLFGFLAQVNTVSAKKLHACPASDISNIRPLTPQRHPLYVVKTSVSSHATGLYMSYNWPPAMEHIKSPTPSMDGGLLNYL